MKKILMLVFVLIVCLVLFSSCFDFDHTTQIPTEESLNCVEHTFGDYQSNEQGHWREYTCGCTSPNDIEEHRDRNNDYLCDICKECLHQISDRFCFDKTAHWKEYVCECTKPIIKNPHTDNNSDGKCDSCEFVIDCEHRWSEESQWGYIGSLPNTPKYVNCNICGEVKVLDSEGTGQTYKIFLSDEAEEYLINTPPSEAKAGTIITLRYCKPVRDSDHVGILANDLYCLWFAGDDNTNTVSFIMPSKDVTVTLTTQIDVLNDYYCYLSYSETWLNNITADDVKEIEMTHHIMNAPVGTLDNVYSICDKNSIEDLINQFKWMPMYDIAGFSPSDKAPKLFFDFILNDGTVYSFYIYCGFLNGHWSLKYIPDITRYSDVDHAYTFVVYFTYAHIFDLNKNYEQICCLNDVDEWEFVLLTEDEFPQGEPTYAIKINYTTLYVVDRNSFYYINENGEKIYCRLLEKDFYTMIEENAPIYSSLIDAFLENNPEITTANVTKYYGISETGAIIGRIVSPEIEYSEYTGHYSKYPINNPIQIQILYNNQLYNLSTAYKNGYITEEDLKTIYQNY